MAKNPPANAGDRRDTGSIPGSGRSPGGGNGHPLQYSRLENPMDRGAWWATVHGGCKESVMTEQLSMHATCMDSGERPKDIISAKGGTLVYLGFVSFSPVPNPLSDLIFTTSHCLPLTKEISQTVCILHTTSVTPLTHQHLMNSQNL